MKLELKLSEEALATLNELDEQGFTIGRSVLLDAPQIPADITTVDDEDLMELFTSVTAYLNFVSVQVAIAQLDERAAERKLDVLMAAATASQPKGLAAVIKASALSDPAVVEASYAHSVKYNYRKLIEVMASNLEREMNLISRELTRRTAGGSSMTRARKFIT